MQVKNMKKTFYYCLIAICTLLAASGCLQAQLSDPKQGDKLEMVVAIVGNDIITQSDVLGYLLQLSQQDQSVNIEDKEMQKKVLDMLIDEKLVVAKAIEDSVQVSEDEVDQRWNYQIQRLVIKYGSEKRVEDIFGMSMSQMKNDFREDIRKQILGDRMKAKLFGEVKVTPNEVKDFFNKYKDSLPVVPTTVELYHLVKNVASDSKSKEELFNLAKAVRDTVMNLGGDFAEYARKYSGDPGTVGNGGELGWAGRGMFFKEFEQAAFALQKGAISMPVETPFGYHVIQTLDKNKDSVKTRHILFKFGQSQEDVEKVKVQLNEIKAQVVAGGSFIELTKQNSDETETKGFGGYLGDFPIQQIPENLRETILKMKDGEVTEPLIFASEPKTSYHIIYRSKTTQEHQASLETDYTQIEMMATNYKQGNLYQEWIKQIRKEMYWEYK